ncbi:hypothetical protein [Marinobacterium aestuariivivens]|uniref:Uncharacterized protein n=1 Tax=Marinobacterium aestuariivivens TaxID=1698799 RepID=A0ABW2A3L2_9GAMM
MKTGLPLATLLLLSASLLASCSHDSQAVATAASGAVPVSYCDLCPAPLNGELPPEATPAGNPTLYLSAIELRGLSKLGLIGF